MKYFIIIISLLFFINPIFSQNTYPPDKKIDDAFNELDDEISEINSDKSLDDTEKDLEETIKNSRKKTKEAFDFSNDEKRSNDIEEENRRIKIIDNLESIMNKKYSKIALGRNYDLVKAVVWFSNFESRSSDEKNLIFLFGFLSPALTAKYTIYFFDEDSKSADIFFILQNTKKRNVYQKVKESFKKDFGEGSKLDENREILRGRYNSIEIYKKIFIEKNEYSVIRYFKNDSDKKIDLALNILRKYKEEFDFKKGFDFSIGAGISTSYMDTKFYSFKYDYNGNESPRYDVVSGNLFFSSLTPVTFPISFSYFYNDKQSLGFTFLTSYSLLRCYTLKSFLDVSLHRLSFKLMLKNMLAPPESKSKFIYEVGLKVMYDAFYDASGGHFTFSPSEEYSIRAPVSFLSAGFTFDLGAQFIIKNLSLTIAYFTDFTAGVSSYDYSNLDINALNMNVSIGMDFRISYYKFKKL